MEMILPSRLALETVHGPGALGQTLDLGTGAPALRQADVYSGSALVGDYEPLPRFATW